MPGLTETALLSFALFLALYTYIRRKNRLPLPPGPRKYPIIGNLLDIPSAYQWETFMQWSKETGSDVVYVETIGVKFIILNSVDAVNDLAVKRSSMYSSRPQFQMSTELMGWGFQFSVMPYGEKWRDRRRLFQRHFPLTRHDNYRPFLASFVRKLQVALLESPEDFFEHIVHMSGGFALALGYGIKIKPINDPFVQLSRDTLGEALRAAVPGRYLVDTIPLLKHVPEWMPGAEFKRKAKIWYRGAQEFRNGPFRQGQKELAAGTATPSFLSMAMEELPEYKDEARALDAIKDVASMFYSGGSDTTVSAVYTFVLIMARMPEIQHKIQREIDSAVGEQHLPSFDDESNLPYLTAVLMEVLRWHPPIPMGIPRYLEEDDSYKGYHMPKGSIVVGNCWALSRNENDYRDPYTFNPDRFLKNGEVNRSVRDPSTIVFGFGRRACPGSHIAWSTLWYTAVSLLSLFEIGKKKDHSGEEIEPAEAYESALVSPPLKFECEFRLRSTTREHLIRTGS